jgi:hypothetical protein
MKFPKWMHVGLVLWMTVYLATPRLLAADDTLDSPVPIKRTIDNIVLHEGQLRGALVDDAGKGVPDAPVLIGQDGKLLKELRTDQDGRFRFDVAKPGLFQVVSHGSAAAYRTFPAEQAPAGAKQGVIHQVDPQVARGGSPAGLFSCLANPIFLALLIGAAIAIPLALDDDDNDDDAS